jgi:uncharacterized protein (DUF736 family)
MENSQVNKQYKDEEVGAFWKRTSQKGQKYLAGHIKDGDESTKLVVFANTNKQNENQPDYRVYKSRPRTDYAAESKPQQSEVATTASEEDLL